MGIHRTNRRAVFLDRDGVIVKATVRDGRPYPPATLADVEILPDVMRSLDRLKRAAFLQIVVTNQPDVARGTQSKAVVEAIHRKLLDSLPIDDIRVCYHDDDAQCSCRKPKPGLLLQSGETHLIDLARSYLIGDRWRDVGAGAAAGCRTVLINRGYSEQQQRVPDMVVASLSDAVDWILGQV